jgi:hypothetical protein
MYSGRSLSMGPLETILAESSSLVPEDHIPRRCSADHSCLKVLMVVTIPVVTLRLKSYNLVSQLLPKGLEIGTMVHVLGINVNKPDMDRIKRR